MEKRVNPETLPASEIPDVRDLRDRCAQILNILIPLCATLCILQHMRTCTNSDRCCPKTGAPSMKCDYCMNNEWMRMNEKIPGATRMMTSVTWDVLGFTLMHHCSFIPAEQFPGAGDAPLLDLQLNQLTRTELCRKQLQFENGVQQLSKTSGKVTVINPHLKCCDIFLSNNRIPHWYDPSFFHWVCWCSFAGNLPRLRFSPLNVMLSMYCVYLWLVKKT